MQSSSAATIGMVLVCVGGWVGACAHAVQRFAFGELGRDGKSGGGLGGSGVSTQTHQDRERPGNTRKIEIII